MRPDMLRHRSEYARFSQLYSQSCVGEKGHGKRGIREEAYISGSFCVSMTAAIGMPKFETGPQKSAGMETLARARGKSWVV